MDFERDTWEKIRSMQKELRAESRHHAHALRALKTTQRAKFVRLKVRLKKYNLKLKINSEQKFRDEIRYLKKYSVHQLY